MKYFRLTLFPKVLLVSTLWLTVSCQAPSESKTNSLAANGETTYTTNHDVLSQEINALINETSVRPFNGVILISQGDKALYSSTRGYSDFNLRTPVKMTDRFRIQSNTKQITAALILIEVERGTIILDAPISDYLPELKQEWSDVVTVHQLLNMTSGITRLDSDLAFVPGTQFHYSNPGYGLLGAILERVEGKSYAELANELFAELGMENTSAYYFGEEQAFIPGHYLSDDDKLVPVKLSDLFTADTWKPFLPAGGVISTAADLLIWDTKLHSGQVVTDQSYKLMTNYSIEASHSAFGPQLLGYGYGVRIDDTSYKKHIGHAGRGIGYASIKLYFPENGLSVIVLENVYISNDPNIVYYFEREIRDLVLKFMAT
jgi:CubicO group peptidase (beta-lactamase class C family)